MKNMAEQYKKTSIPLVLQSFGPQYENPPSNCSSRLKSNPKKIQSAYHQTYYQEENSGLNCQTSRKRLEVEDRAINEHYQNMEKILLNENLNLKQQNSYLTSEVRKALRREEKLKEELRNLNSRLKNCAEEISHIETDYINAKDMVLKQMDYLAIGLKSNNVYQIKNMVWRYIDEVSSHFKIEIEQDFPYREQFCSDKRENEENISEIDNEIQILTNKLEKLLNEEHGQNKGMMVRKQCIEISKQLKQLKEKSRTMSIQSIPQNQMSDIVTGSRPRPSLPVEKSRSKESMPRKQMLRSDSIKEEPEETNRYPTQIYSRIAQRKSINRESKMSRGSSRGRTSMMSPSGSDHRLQ